MKILTANEVLEWLNAHGQIPDPYNGAADPPCRIVFKAPREYPQCECLVRCFLDQVITKGDLLVVVDDAAPAQPCQEFVAQALRLAVGETRPIMDAPGYLVAYEDREEVIALFTLMSCFQWKCYVYGSYDQIVFYNWEGAIFDVWSNSERVLTEIRFIIGNFGLKEIEK